MSVAEAAEELGISTRFAYDLTHTEDFPAIRIGHRTRVSREGLREWVRSQEQNRKAALVLEHKAARQINRLNRLLSAPIIHDERGFYNGHV